MHRFFQQFAFFLCVFFAGITASAQNGLQVTLLPAEQAFKLEVAPLSQNQVLLQWQIATDYYLYRDKIEFEFIGQDITFTAPMLPPGVVKNDPTFGKVETYLDSLDVPLNFSNPKSAPFRLIVRSQGCNEPIGVCYAPVTESFQFDGNAKRVADVNQLLLEATNVHNTNHITSSALASSSVSTLDSTLDSTAKQNSAYTAQQATSDTALKQTLNETYSQQDFLPIEQAFAIRIDQDQLQPDYINFRFNVTEGYYLYRDSIALQQQTKQIPLKLPSGQSKLDPYFGQVDILRHSFTLPITTQEIDSKNNLTLTYQGCAEDGICYAPQKMHYAFENGRWQRLNPQSNNGFFDPQNKTLLQLLLFAFGAGLLLTFTPCVLPLIPILSAIIVGQKDNITSHKGGVLAIAYVAGTILTYSLMGALAGATGAQLQAYFQTTWAVGTLALIFTLMALAMLGLFTVALPFYFQTKLTKISQRLSGSLWAVFALGFISALIVGACVSPILIAFLSVAITQGDPILGAATMASLALGMGVALILYGFGAGKLLPKAGRWMRMVNIVFAILLLIVALYLLGTLPQFPILLAWAALFIIGGFYLWQLANGLNKNTLPLAKSLSILLIVWGFAMLLGASMGQRNPLHPLPLERLSGNQLTSQTLQFINVQNEGQLEKLIQQAQNENKILMLDYYADWCLDCVRMKKTTFQNKAVKDTLNSRFISAQIDVTDAYNEATNALKKRYNVFGPPAFLFIKNGQLISDASFYGYKDDKEMLNHLNQIQ